MKTKCELIEERVQELKNDYGNLSSKELEIKYDASYSTIRKVLYKYNITDSKRTAPIKYKYLRNHIEEFKIDWIDGVLKKDQLEEKYHCPYSALSSLATSIHIKRKTAKDIVDYETLVADVINDEYTYAQLIKKYGICEQTIRKVLKEHGVEHKRDNRKYDFNFNYFDNIDDECKAYWLGFIYADGSHNPKRYSLAITLQENDSDILNEFYKDIGCEKSVKLYKNKKNNKFYAKASVQHPHLSNSLLDKGVYENKSFKIKFPGDDIVPNDLKRHFIRGYFDGDGCISIPAIDKSKVSWSIAGNYDFIYEMKIYIEDNISNYTLNVLNCSNPKIYSIQKGGRNMCMTFFNWLYEDATIYLQRKYNKFLALKEYNKEKEYEKNRRNKKAC